MSEPSARHPWTIRRTPRDRLLLLWDLAIMVLVVINLVWIIFDTLFSIHAVANGIGALWPAFRAWYANTIHRHFFTIDLGFVAVFVIDVLAGWALAIVERRYERWFFYPFVRWYDVLGCIPVAGFRFLRVLRLISLIVRLQLYGVIDIRRWALYRHALLYFDIVVEEISDRVVLKVLAGVQDEVKSGGQALIRRVITDVIEPRRERLGRAASQQLEAAITHAYRTNRRQIQTYAAQIAHRAVDDNPALRNLERMPMLGAFVSQALDQAIREAVTHVLDEAVAGLASAEFDTLVQNITDSAITRVLAAEASEASEIRDVVIEVLDLVKDQVAVQRWRAYFE
jgi:hypothetical protein